VNWYPKIAYFESAALIYPLGRQIRHRLEQHGVPIKILAPRNRVGGPRPTTAFQAYQEGKETLIVGVARLPELRSCRPSADYEFPLGSGCPAFCQYCYLQSTLGRKPFVRVYANVGDILGLVGRHIARGAPRITTFEAASSSDPLAVEHLTGSLKAAVEFFGRQPHGRLRFVTKFTAVDSLLDAKHNGRTRFRFSVNAPRVIAAFEQGTAQLEERVAAAHRVASAGYPIGFLIAPLFIYDGWAPDYRKLVRRLADGFGGQTDVTFELIQFRFTRKSKALIADRFPDSALDLSEDSRRQKYGRYGLVKYVYPDEEAQTLRTYLVRQIEEWFPGARVLYFT
jgi:spore photoproduct lyase